MDLTGKRVVLCEDQGLTVLQLQKALTRAGLQVVGRAASCAEAVEVVLRERPDLVLMDVNMDTPDAGIQATSQILRQFHTCIVMLSAYSDREMVQKALDAGAAGYYLKPIHSDHLIPTLEAALNQFSSCQVQRPIELPWDSPGR